MQGNNLTQIREMIRQAKRFEAAHRQLHILLAQQLDSLHRCIELPQQQPLASLTHFVERYIEHAPDFLEAVHDITERSGIGDYARPLLNVAEHFFLQPPEAIGRSFGLSALLDEAYLAHRLMEEINDRFMSRCGVPLVPMDMTRSNLIAHYLIGESFANELDLLVDQAVEHLVEHDKLFDSSALSEYIADHQRFGWKEVDEWPCLVDDLDISLLGHRQPVVLH